MRAQSSAIAESPIAVTSPAVPTAAAAQGPADPAATRRTRRSGTLQAALGVTAFSLTFPATAWGLEGFGPWSLVAVRGVLAAVVAGGCLAALRVPVPARRHWAGLAVVAGGVVFGFPLLTTLALQTSTTAHAAVVVGLLPLTTALLSALRTGARPSRTFWFAALAGAAAVIAFTVRQSGGALTRADAFLFAALLVCAAGYTEGGRLAKVMPGWQVIGWALVLCLPLSLPGTLLALAHEPVRLGAHSVAGLLWVAIGSQFLGLVVWYRGMAAIGVPKASQLQLAQPLLTLVWSVLLLGEHLTPAAPLTAAAVLVCIAVTQRARG
ncbi:DMT family transporter [Streptomyces sp. NPDC008313]|uniref:DMT family transporter n=1 Tax=Streptomyces sp. NPDC008313 TaxID=3364826 RepID=UPI0036E3B1A5